MFGLLKFMSTHRTNSLTSLTSLTPQTPSSLTLSHHWHLVFSHWHQCSDIFGVIVDTNVPWHWFIYCGGVEEGGGRRGTAVSSHVPRPNHAGRKNNFFSFFRSQPPQSLTVTWLGLMETDNMVNFCVRKTLLFHYCLLSPCLVTWKTYPVSYRLVWAKPKTIASSNIQASMFEVKSFNPKFGEKCCASVRVSLPPSVCAFTRNSLFLLFPQFRP